MPQTNIQYLSWNGVAYIVLDPNTGAAGYYISEGLAGGADAWGSSCSSNNTSAELRSAASVNVCENKWTDCLESIVQLMDLIPYNPGRFAQALEIVAFAASSHDIEQSKSAIPAEKGLAAVYAVASLVIGLFALTPWGRSPSCAIITAVTVCETLLYVNLFYLTEGKLPFEDGVPPYKTCCELGLQLPLCGN